MARERGGEEACIGRRRRLHGDPDGGRRSAGVLPGAEWRCWDELLIVSDIIHTALSLAFNDLLVLGLPVLIRSLISFFLDREIRDIRAELGDGER